MKDSLDEHVGRFLAVWIDGVREHARWVVLGVLLLTIPFGVLSAQHLGMNSDSVSLVGQDLPARRNHDAFAALFPNLENAFLIVVDGANPERTREAASSLRDALAARTDRFTEVYVPGGGEFFERNGLLYRNVDDLEIFSDEMARIQPVLAELERDPSLANLVSLVQAGLEEARRQGVDQADGAQMWPDVLDRVGQATVRVYDEFPIEVSWEELLLRGSAIEITTRRVLIAHPILDFGSVLAARDALAAIRTEVAALDLAPERGVTVRITGNPVLNYEEMIGLAWDIGVAGIFCFLLVAFLLDRALRSLRLTIASIATLLVGLVWTVAFATAAVGHLNIISMAFGILFIGLGVDFCIHFGMRYADLLRGGIGHACALRGSMRSIGSSLVICASTTAIGFFVFVPTTYLGVAELGLIAGGGMLVILTLTLTFFPALLTWGLRVDPTRDLRRDVVFQWRWWLPFQRHPVAVRRVALALAVGSVVLVPRARFDPDAVRLRDPGTESVQTFYDLLEATGTSSPWYIDAVAPDLDTSVELAHRLEALDVVETTITLADYVPPDQEQKLEILSDVAFLLDPTGALPGRSGPLPGPEEQVASLRELHTFLSASWIEGETSVLARSMRHLRDQLGTFLDRVEREGGRDQALATLDALLLEDLPEQVARLRRAIAAEAFDIGDLPPPLRARMLAQSGQARVQIFPSETLMDEESFQRFTDGVREVAPRATGIAVNLMEFGRACQRAFRQALASALCVIALLLWLLWRNVRETLLVLCPLLLAALLTPAVMVLADIPFNFVNLIVIPLLFGIGVDSAIHLVHRARDLDGDGESLLETTTARAVFYSALTTTASFGSLAFSSHRGMESLGIVLVFGMTLTVLCNLVVLPALLAWSRERRDAAQ